MKITLYGATGIVGQRILQEALQRGHEVTAVVRDPSRLAVTNNHLTVVTGDVTDAASMDEAVRGQEVVVVSVSGRRDHDNSIFTEAAQTILETLPKAGVERLVWVGGAGSLEIAPNVRVMDTPEFPAAYLGEARAQGEVLNLFRTANTEVDWTFLSPPAEIAPGERTGTYRLGGDQLLFDTAGKSHISTEDYAVALLDEIEKPTHTRQRFTVAY